jgi:DNA mismatch repair ATPase MutS
MAIERWRRLHGAQMLEWIAALGEIEALISLSTYSYEHPGDTFPELVERGPVFDAEGWGHPLLEESTCVRNDLQLGDTVQFLIVSGSNMSGKSTFLRAIGLNAVLAYMGAPVRCKKLRLSSLTIGAAVRMQESVVAFPGRDAEITTHDRTSGPWPASVPGRRDYGWHQFS